MYLPIRGQRGLTLVELMISMVLALILAGGVIALYISSTGSYTASRALSNLFENGHFAFKFLKEDLSQVGYLRGCGPDVQHANGLETSSGVTFNADRVRGYEVAGGSNASSTGGLWPLTLTATDFAAGSDLVSLIHHELLSQYSFDANNHLTSGELKLAQATHALAKGSVLVTLDEACTQKASFVLSSEGGQSAGKLNRNVGVVSGVALKNCEMKVSGKYNCDNRTGAVSEALPLSSKLYLLKQITYGLKQNPNAQRGVLSLYRFEYEGHSSSWTEVIRGVKNMTLEYGIATNATSTGFKHASRYMSAAQLNSSGYDWNDVVSVNIQLEMMSEFKVDGQHIERNMDSVITLRNLVVDL